MERNDCIMIKAKNLCPYNYPENILRSEYCCRCTLPDVYSGKRKVPESHCEAARVTGFEEPPKGIDTEIDKLYYWLINNSTVFKNMNMDRQGEIMNKIKNLLTKDNE